MNSSVIDIGSRLELFVDFFLIERLDGPRLQLNNPMPANTALRFDQPWEGPFSGYATVIKDRDLYRLYYRGWPDAKRLDCGAYCYAESTDGIAFKRPNLGLHAI